MRKGLEREVKTVVGTVFEQAELASGYKTKAGGKNLTGGKVC